MNNSIWTIAGSDTSAGAGIQADIKAAHSFSVHACSVITALTAQNSMGVEDINSVPIKSIASQLDALEQDTHARVIKIGLLANAQQVEFIANTIKRYKTTWPTPPIVVYDPVAVASSGDSLTEDDIVPAIKTYLLPCVDVITPNTQEAQILTGVYLIGPDAVVEAANVFTELGVPSGVIKGGHWDYPKGYCVDYGWQQDECYWLGNKQINSPHSHGTGCSFASSLAANLAKDYTSKNAFKDAFILAKAYINQGLKHAKRYGQGIGPVAHCGFPECIDDYPEVIEADSWLGQALDFEVTEEHVSARDFAGTDSQNLGIYPVVDSVLDRALLKSGH
jgi:hydroxymethylpyrimidine kinase/phosphomethylpyrimidine kinase/thiamine-phosphate diphosphorylase